ACPTEGSFYPPTLFTDVQPSSTIAQVEIFGPVLVTMTFRTPEESVALANNTPYGLAASIWTESINLALDIAPKIKAGVVWINSTNLFDAAAGFGGYRESGFGREGGREGMWEDLKRGGGRGKRGEGGRELREGGKAERGAASEGPRPGKPLPPPPPSPIPPLPSSRFPLPQIDRTPKLFIGGKQARPDQGYSRRIYSPSGELVGESPEGNRKDLRNAVEAAHKAAGGWSRATGHNRGQIL